MTDLQQQEAGKVIKMGIGQLKNDTPVWMKNISRGFIYVSGLWAILAPMATHIPQHVIFEIDHYLLVGNAALRFTINFFGWSAPSSNDKTT